MRVAVAVPSDTVTSTANPSTFGATNLAPFNNVFLGRPDLFPIIDLKNAGTTLAPFPTPIVLETLDNTYQTPRTYNYNLTLEREVSQGIMVRAACGVSLTDCILSFGI